jgi:hypothetical protein
MAKKRAKVSDTELFAKTEETAVPPPVAPGQVRGKDKITLYLSDELLDALDLYWRNQPRSGRLSKSKITEAALWAWLDARKM